MASALYQGHIKHTEATIFRLFRTQYRCFCQKQMLLRFLLGLALVFLAVLLGKLPYLLRLLALIAGAWFMVSLDFPSQMNADRALELRRTALPEMRYAFSASEVQISGESSRSIQYDKLIRLAEDAEYLYLFSSREMACMIERATITPGDEKLMDFLAQKTGLEWKSYKSFFFLNLYDLVHVLKMMKRK